MRRDGTSLVAAWRRKFGDAFDGLFYGIRTESSLQVHFLVAMIVLVVAAILAIELWRWAVLLICIAMVITAEYFNSAIEQLVRSLNPGHKPEIAKALHLAAAAVLVASLLATLVGIIVLAFPLKESLGL
jgi:diacylglycerol kinase (ATP)